MRPSQFRQPPVVVYWFSLKSSQGRSGVIAPKPKKPVRIPGSTTEVQVVPRLRSSYSLFQELCIHAWYLAKIGVC